MKDIWDVFKSFQSPPPVTPVNLELFWDRWIASKPTTSGSANLRNAFENRQILYWLDSYEADNDIPSAITITVGVEQVDHTLYSDGDSDYVKFTPAPLGQYSIRTRSLRNGADTFLVLYDAASNTVTTNDNSNGVTYVTPTTSPFNCSGNPSVCHENGNDILGSLISFTAPASITGPYKIRVRSSLSKPDSAGRYGTYNLLVTSP
jgi:hypothetical protein